MASTEPVVKDLVQRILKDTSAYDDLRERLEEVKGDARSGLIETLRDLNPPLLGTGGTS